MAKTKENYSAKDIQTLEFPDTVRHNPGMYVGGSNARGNKQCIYELVSNAVDEYLAGHCTEIYVKLNTKENSVVICDNGRGMPVDKHKKTGEPAIYLIFGSLHAGGKMSGSTAYVSSGGLHGVGAAAANALAGRLVAQTFKNDKWHELEYNAGILKKKLRAFDGASRMVKAFKKGTQILWTPDTDIFKQAAAQKIDRDGLGEMLSDLAYLCSGLKLHFDVDGKVETYHQEKGGYQFALDAFDLTFDEKEEVVKLNAKPYHFASKDVEISLLWTSHEEEHLYSYTNCILNPGHGTHTDAVRDTVYKTFKKVFPNKGNYSKAALFQGVVGLVSIRLKERPEYEGQTKDKLTSESARKLVSDAFTADFEKWVRNTSACEKIVNFAIGRGRAAAKMKEELDAQAKELNKEIADNNKRKHVFCPKLKDAYGCKPEDRELFLVEGESAGGTLMQARDNKYQAVLLLKGKFSNAFKDKPRSLFQNEDIKNIFTSLGVMPGQKDAAKKARVKRIMLMSDPDVDGRHINCLGIGLLTRFLPDLIDAGKVYVVRAPLYILTDSKGKKQYAMDDKERDAILKKGGKFAITRMKGWGEADPDFIQEVAMNPETRQLCQLQRNEKSDQIVENIMGENVIHRKKLLNIEVRENEFLGET